MVRKDPLSTIFTQITALEYVEIDKHLLVLMALILYNIPDEATNRTQKDKASPSGQYDDNDSGYADDLAAAAWTINDLQIIVNILYQVFSEFGLAMNLEKTETMVLNWNHSSDGEYPQSIVSINNAPVQNSLSFKYLGVWLTGDNINIGKDELNHRVNSAHNAFAENRKLLTNMHVHLGTRIMFLESLVRSRLTYGCHAWRPTQAEISKIESTYRYFLRCMIWNGHARVNPPQENHDSSDETDDDIDWSYVITNEKLYQITNSSSISEFVEKRRIHWISHVIRRENSDVCKILTFHSTKRKEIGRKCQSILERAVKDSGLSMGQFLKDSFKKNNI